MESWKAEAAYFYILHLDRSALAWEYLRRNSEYRRQWRDGELVNSDVVGKRWGCETAEDPDLDARAIRPTWTHEPPDVVRVTASEMDVPGLDQGFSVWDMPGKQYMSTSDRYWSFLLSGLTNDVQVKFDSCVEEGKPYAYVIRADQQIQERLKTLSKLLERLNYLGIAKPTAIRASLSRRAHVHARALQAIDGVRAGASQRNIAATIFGETEIAKRWAPDSELRAQVRYLIRRGSKFINGGYRSLLMPVRAKRQGGIGA